MLGCGAGSCCNEDGALLCAPVRLLLSSSLKSRLWLARECAGECVGEALGCVSGGLLAHGSRCVEGGPGGVLWLGLS